MNRENTTLIESWGEKLANVFIFHSWHNKLSRIIHRTQFYKGAYFFHFVLQILASFLHCHSALESWP